MIVHATLEKPIGQPDSCAQARRKSPGLDNTELRMLPAATRSVGHLEMRCHLVVEGLGLRGAGQAVCTTRQNQNRHVTRDAGDSRLSLQTAPLGDEPAHCCNRCSSPVRLIRYETKMRNRRQIPPRLRRV